MSHALLNRNFLARVVDIELSEPSGHNVKVNMKHVLDWRVVVLAEAGKRRISVYFLEAPRPMKIVQAQVWRPSPSFCSFSFSYSL